MATVITDDERVRAYVNRLDPARQTQANAILDLIREAAPDAEETFKWNMPVFVQNGLLCSITAFKDHINLGFYKGAELTDPEGLLEGTGKGVRHVKVYSNEDIRPAQFRKWIQEAVRLNQA